MFLFFCVLVTCVFVLLCPLFADDVLLEGEGKITLAPRPDDVVLQDRIRYVQKVVDGDTIIVRWNDLIRLIGVDAPEVESPYGKEEYYGPEAKKYLESLLAGQKVLIKVDPQNIKARHKDKYGRQLGYVYSMNGTFVNAKLVEEGYARAMKFFSYQHKDEFLQLEEKAKVARNGIWKSLSDEKAE